MPALAPRRPKRRTEATVLAETRLALCSMPGVTVWRNTTGFAETDGRKFRYGLCPGSSDLVGCLRVTPATTGCWKRRKRDGQETESRSSGRGTTPTFTRRIHIPRRRTDTAWSS